MVLVRDDGAAPDGVVSIATSAVRYETTTVATAAFARLASGALAAAPSITLPDETPLGDEVRGWRYRRAAVRVDETILRVRSVVLGLILVVSDSNSDWRTTVFYAKLLRSKLPE